MARVGTFEAVLGEIGQALLPLRTALRSRQDFFAFMLKLGCQAEHIPQPLSEVRAALDTLFDALRRALGDGLNVESSVRATDDAAPPDVHPDDVARILQGLQQVVAGVRAIASAPDAAIPP